MGSPMYREIADDLRRQIESGDLASGGQLPTEIVLRARYDASRNTVRDAIKWLISLGLVETKPGQGTFVVERFETFTTSLTGSVSEFDPSAGDQFKTEMRANKRKYEVSPVQVEIQRASEQIANRLGIARDSQVISRHERRSIDDHPWSMQTSYYPMAFADRGAKRLISADDIAEGTVKYLANKLDIRQSGYRDWITVRSPNAGEAEFFKIAADGRISVFVIFRIAFDAKRKPMRLTITVYPTDRNQFIVNVGAVPDPEPQENPASQES